MDPARRDCLIGDPEPLSKPITVDAGASVVFLHEHFYQGAGSVSRLVSDALDIPIGSVFDPEDVIVLRQAMNEACSFLLGCGPLGPAKRRQVALIIMKYAIGGLRDPHRLAIKGIVGAG